MQVYELNDIDGIVYELKSNRAAIIETDTQLGIVSLNPKLIYALKRRSRSKPLIKLIPDVSFVKTDNEIFHKLAKAFWPGQLTIIINKESYRIPNHKQLLKLLHATGPLYSSSANISNQQPLKEALDAMTLNEFKQNEEKLFIVSGKEKSAVPSTIFNVDSGTILRRGSQYQQLLDFLKKNGINYRE